MGDLETQVATSLTIRHFLDSQVKEKKPPHSYSRKVIVLISCWSDFRGTFTSGLKTNPVMGSEVNDMDALEEPPESIQIRHMSS